MLLRRRNVPDEAAAAAPPSQETTTTEQKITIGNKEVTLTKKEAIAQEEKRNLQKDKWDYAHVFPPPPFFWDYFKNIDRWAYQWALHTHSEARRATTVQIEGDKATRQLMKKTKEENYIQLEKCKKRLYIALLPQLHLLEKYDFDVDKLPPANALGDDPKRILNEIKEIFNNNMQLQNNIDDITDEIMTSERERDAHQAVICLKIDNEILKERIKRTKNLNTDSLFRTYEQNEKMVKDFVLTLGTAAAGQASKEKKTAMSVIRNGFEQVKGNMQRSVDDELKNMLKELVLSQKTEGPSVTISHEEKTVDKLLMTI